MTAAPIGRVVTLSDLCEVNPRKPNMKAVDDDESALFVPMAAVDQNTGAIAQPEQSTVGAVGRRSYRSFTSGDVLFAKITPCMENGKSAVVPIIESGYGFGSTEFHVLRPRPGVPARLLWHFVRSQAFRREAARNFKGTVGQLRVPPEFLKRAELAVPESPQEREELVDRLDAVANRRSRTLDRLDRATQLLSDFHDSLLSSACIGKITSGWRAQRRAGGSADARRLSEPDPSLLADLPALQLPEHFGLTTIGAVCEIVEYGTSKKCHTDEVGVPVLRMGNLQRGTLCLDDLKYADRDDEIDRLMLVDGDVLFNRTNSPELVGKAAVFHESSEMSFASYLIRFRVHETIADPDFICFWINSAWGRSWANHVKTDGVSQSNINGTKLKQMPVPLPPLDEQVEIVRQVREMLQRAAALEQRLGIIRRSVEHGVEALLDDVFSRSVESGARR